MTATKQHSIFAKALTIGYKTKKKTTVVASNISLEAKQSSFIALLGKNGIGKSTLLKTLSKVLPTIKGSINIFGKNIDAYTETEFAKTVSIVLTEKLPQSNLSVYELIALGRQPYTNWLGTISSEDKKHIQQAISLCEIQEIANKKHYQLSDGQLQKVLIARALAQDTPIILLDEPTAHLDIHHTINMLLLLKKIASETQKTIIISTHQVNLALQLADTLWLLTENNFVIGTPTQLIEKEHLQALFPSEVIRFDKDLKQFIVQ